jgi:trans-2,3-dihydro-3-hydroxyanthranilic acid synthase
MSIPQIENYQLRSADLSVINIVKWRQENERSILLVHDMQQYFLDLYPLALRRELVENCKNLLCYAREHNIPVVYTAQRGDMSEKERGLLLDIWGKGMSSQSEHTVITEELAPEKEEAVLAKWRYSAFHATTLHDIFLEHHRDQMIICGVFAHIGVLTSAIDAYSRDIEVFLVQDAIADFSKQAHFQALKNAAECCAKVLPTQEVCQ